VIGVGAVAVVAFGIILYSWKKGSFRFCDPRKPDVEGGGAGKTSGG